MPDTHDERGGDEAAVRIAAMLKAYREYDDDQPVEIVHSGLYLTIGDVRGLVRDRDQLAAATARAEKAEALAQQQGEIIKRNTDASRSVIAQWEAWALRAEGERDEARTRLAELGEPETEQRIIGVSGLVYEPTLRDLENQAYWLPGVRLEERQVYPTPWRVATEAAPEGRSEPVERSEEPR